MFYSYSERKYIIETPAEPITVDYFTQTGRGTITLNTANVFPCTVHDIKTIIDILWKSSDSYGIAEKIADYLRACVSEIQTYREKLCTRPSDAKIRAQLSGMIKKYISNLDKIADAFGFESLTDCEVETMKMSKCEVLCNENDPANTNETGRKITTYAGKTFTKGGIVFQVHQKCKKGARYITIPGTGSFCASYSGPEKEAPSHISDNIIESLKKCAENGKIQETRADFVKVCNACGITPDALQDIFTQAPQNKEPETVTECTQETTPETVPAIDINAFIEDCEKSENYYYNAGTTTQNAEYKKLLDYGEKIITYSAPIPGLTEKQTRAFIRLLISARGDYFTSDREIVSFAENVIYYFGRSTEKAAEKPQTETRADRAQLLTGSPAHGPQVWKPCTMSPLRKYGIIYHDIMGATDRHKPASADRLKAVLRLAKMQGYINLGATDKNPVTGTEQSHKAILNLTAYAHGRPPETRQKSALFALGPRCHTADRRKIKQKSPPEFFKQGVEFTQSSHLKMVKNGTLIFQGGAGYQKFCTENMRKKIFKKI